MTERIVLAGAVRTAIGKFGGSLSAIPTKTLGAVVMREALRRSGIPAQEVDEVLMGCVLPASQGQNIARQAAMEAGIPKEVPASTLNNVCGSGLKAVNLAAAMILSGQAEVVMAGGMENMSSTAYALPNARYGYRMNNGALVDMMVQDGLWDAFGDYHMGITAEQVASLHSVSRGQQDNYALQSQKKARSAIESGKFADEIVAVPVPQKKGDPILFDTDEHPRFDTTAQSLGKLRPSFLKDGTVTAGNASGVNDGAAAILVLSESKAKALEITPMAVWTGGASVGLDPAVMGLGPVYAIQKLLKEQGLAQEDIDLFEVNEAFAAQACAVQKLLDLDPDRVNVNGGAIALGHPIGASGCRVLVTLLHELSKRGVASLCIGGGMGIAASVERL